MSDVLAQFVSSLLADLSRCVTYVVLHGYADLPHTLGDLDLAVPDAEYGHARTRVDAVAQLHGGRVLKDVRYDRRGSNVLVVGLPGGAVQQVDFLHDTSRLSAYAFTGDELVGGRVSRGAFFIPSPAMEAAYLLTKRSVKGNLTQGELARIRETAPQPVPDTVEEAVRFGLEQMRRRRGHARRVSALVSEVDRVAERLGLPAGDYFRADELSMPRRRALAAVYREVRDVPHRGPVDATRFRLGAPLLRARLTAYVFAHPWPWIDRFRDPRVLDWLRTVP